MAWDSSQLGQPTDATGLYVYGPNGTPMTKDQYSTWSATQPSTTAGAKTSPTANSSGATTTLGSGASDVNWGKTGWNIDYQGQHQGDSNWYMPEGNDFGFQLNTGNGIETGNIDPTTGLIKATTHPTTGAATTSDYQYDPTADYGLGSSALGIIPLEHNSQGQVSIYLAPTSGGGFAKETTLAAAQNDVNQYNTWMATTKNAPATTTTTPATTSTDTSAQTSAGGFLANPGVGETTQAANAGKYNGVTNAQTVFNETPNQPTNAQQNWNAYSGIFGNPGYLDSIYNTAGQEARANLMAQGAAGGYGDSGATARATSDIDLKTALGKLQATEGWATTGQGMAQGADAANNSQTQTRGALATSADTANLNQTVAGQNAANAAEGLAISRGTGMVNSATTLANDQATLTLNGMEPAMAQEFLTQMTAWTAQVQSGTLTAQQAYNNAQELMSTLGVAGNAVIGAWATSKIVAAKTGGAGTATTTTPSTGTVTT
jgi:hypothetical protein